MDKKTVAVPVEATVDMVVAGINANIPLTCDQGSAMRKAWAAMIAAAPAATAQQDEREALVELCCQQIEANKNHQTMLAWGDAETPKRFLNALTASAATDTQDAQERDKCLHANTEMRAYRDDGNWGEIKERWCKDCDQWVDALTTAQPADKPEGKAAQQAGQWVGDKEYWEAPNRPAPQQEMTDENLPTLAEVIREAIDKVIKYPFAPVHEREKCLKFALIALSTIEARHAELAAQGKDRT